MARTSALPLEWALVTATSKVRPPANALAKLRVDAHLSISTAAETLDIAEDVLSAIEGSTSPASTTLLADMARLYHASPHAIVVAYLADRRA
jgi:DNA-binding XRE family transcriptional regulator